MANKTNHTISGKDGKEYNYCRLQRKVEVYDEKTGEFKIVKKQFYGENQKKAQKKIDEHEEYIRALKIELSKSTSEKLAERTFGASVKAYIDNTFIPDSSIKDATKLRYVNSYHNIFDDQDLLNKQLKSVSGEDIQAVFTASEIAPSSKEAALKLLRNFYKYAASQLIAHDVTQGIVIPKAKKKRQDQAIEVYSDYELRAFLERTPADHRIRFLIVMAIETGCRIGELLALTYDDIDIESDRITINKSVSEVAPIKGSGQEDKKVNEIVTTKSIDSVRVMPVTPRIKRELARHKSWHRKEMLEAGYRSNQIFTSKSGELYFASNLRMALKRLVNKINKEILAENTDNESKIRKAPTLIENKGWHTFRHTYGSDLAAAGVPIQEVCKLMGHSDISVTAKYYVNITTDQKKEAAGKLQEYRSSRMVASGR